MNVVEIKKEDIPDAARVLADSFRHDPIFNYIFLTKERYHQYAPWLFSTWVRWAILYGKAWMTEDKKVVLLARSPERANMNLWSMIRSGMLPTPVKLGYTSFKRFYFEIVTLLDKKHFTIMGKEPHWLGWMLGVDPGASSNTSGLVLINHLTQIADKGKVPIYLETSIGRNVTLFHYKNFRIKDEAQITKGNFPLYFMVREPVNVCINCTGTKCKS
jgi:hypothetical protein